MTVRRIDARGTVLRTVQCEVPASLYRRLEREKARTGQSLNAIITGWLLPHLQSLPADPHDQRRIES